MRFQFARYLIVGAFLGVATLLVRALCEHMLPATRASYLASVAIAYALGIAAGFFLHARFTFGHAANRLSPRQFLRFTMVALAQIAVVSALATWLHYTDVLARLPADAAGAIALVIAVLVAAVGTFLINRAWVYR
jgi:putative flippase GtrA